MDQIRMYDLDIKGEADRIFRKLSMKNPKQFRIIGSKVEEIRKKLNHVYKFLRKPLQGFNRVHIDRHYALVFKIDHARETVIVYYFDHHDNVYRWRPRDG